MRALFAVFLLVFSLNSNAQNWPSKPMRYIVPFPPGAFNDTLGRTISAELSKTLGQPVVVDNRPGANSIIGTEAAAK
jgi:tripartite-type tricarboxylate transporter receptor subunit TctC